MNIRILSIHYSFYIYSFSLFTVYGLHIRLLNDGVCLKYRCEFAELMALHAMGESVFYEVCNLVLLMELESET